MGKAELNKKIKARNKIYYDACDRINHKYHKKIEAELNLFRMKCINEILRLQERDRTLIKYRNEKSQSSEKMGEGE